MVAMDAAGIVRALDDVFDEAIVFHAFTEYLRDYEVIVFVHAPPNSGRKPKHLRYLFKYCVHAEAETAVRPEVWAKSLDDRLIDYDTGVDLDGYVWGVNFQVLYPGGKLVEDSPRARTWQDALGIAFHEVRVETNGHNLTLVFSDLEVSELPKDYAPFRTD